MLAPLRRLHVIQMGRLPRPGDFEWADAALIYPSFQICYRTVHKRVIGYITLG